MSNITSDFKNCMERQKFKLTRQKPTLNSNVEVYTPFHEHTKEWLRQLSFTHTVLMLEAVEPSVRNNQVIFQGKAGRSHRVKQHGLRDACEQCLMRLAVGKAGRGGYRDGANGQRWEGGL